MMMMMMMMMMDDDDDDDISRSLIKIIFLSLSVISK